MGNGILSFGTHFSKGKTCFLHLEDRVIAKTVLATEGGNDLALNDTFEQIFLEYAFRLVANQCYDGTETASAVFLALHFGKEATNICR